MKLLEITLPTAAENLALDEALLERVDTFDDGGKIHFDILRIWEPDAPMVVVGRASKVEDEINTDYCEHNGVPIRRRCSGGASVVAVPGCLMYAVVISLDRHPELRMIERAHSFVLNTICAGLNTLGIPATMRGTSDLTIGDRKFSGNSLRCKRNAILYHGTILCDANLEQICDCLRTAPRQPEYRIGRSHADFIVNLGVSTSVIRQAVIECWPVDGKLDEWPRSETSRLAVDRYSSDAWNLRH